MKYLCKKTYLVGMNMDIVMFGKDVWYTACDVSNLSDEYINYYEFVVTNQETYMIVDHEFNEHFYAIDEYREKILNEIYEND